jgi:RND family efflux transporter MFP subunit
MALPERDNILVYEGEIMKLPTKLNRTQFAQIYADKIIYTKFLKSCVVTHPIIKLIPLCLLLVSAGCGSNGAKTATEEPVIPVIAAKVIRGNIASTIYTTGTIFPKQESMISPKTSGRIEKLYVDEGDKVEKGQPLVELEQEMLRIVVKEAKAYLKEARAQLKNLESTLKRRQKLFEEGVVGSQSLDDITTERDLAKARVQRTRASLERAEQDLKDTVITAPFDGFIVEKMMNEGEMATTMPPSNIFHLVDTRRVKIECGITEGKRRFITTGKEVLIEMDAYPDEVFNGKITTVNPKVDPNSRTFKIKIDIPNPDFRLESGMFARIRIIERESKNALLIPQRVIINGEAVKKVFAVENGRAVKKSITTGILNHPIIEVTEGLKEGDIVVTEGFYSLKDGIKVKASLASLTQSEKRNNKMVE